MGDEGHLPREAVEKPRQTRERGEGAHHGALAVPADRADRGPLVDKLDPQVVALAYPVRRLTTHPYQVDGEVEVATVAGLLQSPRSPPSPARGSSRHDSTSRRRGRPGRGAGAGPAAIDARQRFLVLLAATAPTAGVFHDMAGEGGTQE